MREPEGGCTRLFFFSQFVVRRQAPYRYRGGVVTLTGLTSALLGVAVSFAAANAVQGRVHTGDRPVLGVGVSFLTDGEETGTGFAVDISKGLGSFKNVSIRGVGDFGWQLFDGFTSMSLQGGVRVAAGDDAFAPFGQFLVGMVRFRASFCDGRECSESNLLLAPGAGVDIAITPRIFLRAQVDFFAIRYPEDTVHAARLTFGISMPFGG